MEQALELVPGRPRRRARRHPARDQRPAVADAGRHARSSARRPRSRASGRPPRSGSRRRPGIARARRRVDDPRQLRDRPARLRHRALLRPPARRRTHIAARSAEGFNKTYGIVHPMEQWASQPRRPPQPGLRRQVELGAVFFEAAGWERPFWYGANEPLLGEYGDRVMPRDGRVGVALVVADHQRRAPRDARPGRDGRPRRVRDLRRHRPGRPRPTSRASSSTRSTCRSGGSSTRRC